MPAAGGRVAGRCDHCGRAVYGTRHTRTDYTVDYYSLYGGHGEVVPLPGDERGRGQTYVRLLDRFDVISCADCYRRAEIRAERERRFRPERSGGEETNDA